MFYLNEFFKTLGESAIRGFSFLFFSCLLAFSLTHRSWISTTLDKIQPERMVNPYFVAVIDGTVDSSQVKGFLSGLPGVLDVDETESQKSKGKIESLVSQLGSDYSLQADLMDFKSMRVILNSALSAESLDFVRDQVVKMGGSSHVSATEIKYPEVTTAMKAHPFYGFLSRAGDWGVIGLLALCWIISYWLCYDVFRSRSYIIEKFQRKKLVAAKTVATGLAIVILTFTSMGVWNGTLKFMDSVLLLMIFSVFWTFSMQEWKWKPTL